MMIWVGLRRGAWLAVAAILAWAEGAHATPAPVAATVAASPDPDTIAPDPAVRRGRLANGMRYAILSNAHPAHSVSIRLRFDVGSWVERDDERGVAHYLEHMAFAGGRAVPGGELEKRFTAQGVAYGRDQNAATGLFDTTYGLDLPVADPAKLDLAFAWLGDVADGLNLTREAVDRERGVIQHERESGLGPARSYGEKVAAFAAPNLRRSRRDPIGTQAGIDAMTAGELRAFYRRWYRPENALLVIVGDAPVDALEARVLASFSGWKASGRPAPRPRPGGDDRTRRLDVLTSAEPRLGETLGACFERPVEPVGLDDVARLRVELLRALASGILNARLLGLTQQAPPPYLGAAVSVSQDDHELAQTCLGIRPINGDWRTGLVAATRMVRQFQAHGATAFEIQTQLADQLARARSLRDGADALTSAELAGDMVTRLARGDVFARFDERERVLERAAAGITPAQVLDQFRRDFHGAGPLLTAAAPVAPDPAALRQLWVGLQQEPPLPPFVPAPPKPWAYADFGAPGRVVSRTEIQDPGFVRLTLSNGVIVNFKQVGFAPNQVLVHVAFGAGRSELPAVDQMAWTLGAQLMPEGGLGRHDMAEVKRLFHDRHWSVGFHVGDHWFDLLGQTTPEDLGLQLQVLGAFLTDPGFRDTLDARFPTAVAQMLRAEKASPEAVGGEALIAAVAPGSPMVLPSRERLLAIRSRDFERLFKPAMTTAPLEVTVLGDISEAKAIPLLDATLGALPSRPATPRVRKDAWWLRFPKDPPRLLQATHEGAPEKALVMVVWPLYVANPAQRREERTLELITDLFRDALRHRIREQMGDTYTPNASMNTPDFGDQGELDVAVEASPGRSEEVLAAVRALAADLAAGKITAEQLEAVRRPKLDAGADRKQTLDWWLGAMAASAREPGVLEEQLNWEAMFATITLDEVKATARKWLSNPGVAVVVLPKAGK